MPRVGKWASASLWSWVVCAALGALWVAATPRRETDWLGGRVLLPLACAFVAGTVFSVLFATISLFKAERGVGWAWLLATPMLLLFLALGAWYVSAQQNQEASHRAVAASNAYLEQIVANPEIVLAQRWAEARDARFAALMASFNDSRVRYTDADLRRLYDEAPNVRDYLFRHPGCSPQFIREHFDEAFERARTTNTTMLDSMIANPNLPQDLRERLPRERP